MQSCTIEAVRISQIQLAEHGIRQRLSYRARRASAMSGGQSKTRPHPNRCRAAFACRSRAVGDGNLDDRLARQLFGHRPVLQQPERDVPLHAACLRRM